MSTPSAPSRTPSVTLAVLAVSGVAFALLQSLVAPALPDIQTELDTSAASVAWVLTGYLLSASVATPIVGRLGDMFGKARVLLVVLVILCVGTALAAVASSIAVLIAARVIQGVGGGIFPLAFGIIRDEFPREKVAGAIGLMSALLGIGGGLGIVLAGVIVDNLSYHWLFWLPLLAVVPAAIATRLYVPESPVRTPGRINWAAALLMSLGLAAVLLAVSEGEGWGWLSARAVGLFVVGLLLLAAWVRTELRSEVPLVDMQMMRLKGVWTTNLVGLLLGVGMYSSFILVPQLVQQPESTGYGFGASVTQAGLFMVPSALFMLIAGSFAGRLEARFGSKPPLMVGTAFTAASFLVLIVAHDRELGVYLSSVLQGIGIGLAFASLANLIVQNVRQDQTGVATGMNTVMRSLGGAIGGQIAAAILAAELIGGRPSEGGFTAAFVFCFVALLVGLATCVLIPGRPRADRAPSTAAAAAD
ncbi:MFS transporter [Patulibacter sp.]|uniref:MFS transporter n=1 Tax=Patulibacter sp. TaxID=1912859 RepID=UPI0027263BD1|nr:MFS transporter [Patulibacter sp.]MDO9408310.1 MFS transporter [Patulibacter sp.]